MAGVVTQPETAWTAADLFERFGAIPLSPYPAGPAARHGHRGSCHRGRGDEDRLCELVDGILVEKAMGTYESWLAGYIQA